MSRRGHPSEVDFFDEPVTQEAPGARPRRRRRVGAGPPGRPVRTPSGLTPLLRLAGLVAIAIVVVVVLTSWIQGCRSDGRKDAYRDYVQSMSVIAADSQRVGQELNGALTTPGIRLPQLRQKLAELAQQQEQDVARARELTPPGRLRPQHQQAIEALQFRVSGLQRLQNALQQAATDAGREPGAVLVEPMWRLLASDVIWNDQFTQPVIDLLRAEEIGGAQVPDSTFLANADLATERAMGQWWERVQRAAGGDGQAPAGLHGSALVSVRALPGGQVLSADQENIIVATADLAFEAVVENSGDSQEVGVKVTLELSQQPRPIKQEQTIDLISPGERKPVRFANLNVSEFAERINLKVEVAAVPGETRLANNSATYPVTFSLTPP